MKRLITLLITIFFTANAEMILDEKQILKLAQKQARKDMANHARRLALEVPEDMQIEPTTNASHDNTPRRTHDERFKNIRKKYFNQLMTPDV